MPKRSWPSEELASEVADAMFALSTPSRVQILGRLLSGPCTVSDLTEALGMEQSAVSHQMRVLRAYKMVRVAQQGRVRVYALYNDDVVSLVQTAFAHGERRTHHGLGGRLRRVSS